MAIIPTHFFQAIFEKKDMMNVLLEMREYKNCIQPVKAQYIGMNNTMHQDNPYSQILIELEELLELLQIEVLYSKEHQLLSVDQVFKELKELKGSIEGLRKTQEEIKKDYLENIEALNLLNHLKEENISLDSIRQLHYLHLKFGKIPTEQVKRIEQYETCPFIYHILSNQVDYTWLVYCTNNDNMAETDNVFSAMGFQLINIPDFVHGNVGDAILELEAENKTMQSYLETLEERCKKIREVNSSKLLKYYASAKYLKEVFEQDKYLINYDTKYCIYFYSPKSKKDLNEMNLLKNIYLNELPIDIFEKQGVDAPLYLSNHQFFKPFEKLMSIHTGDLFDPTPYISCIMFISTLILVGDIGMGVSLLLISLMLKNKKELLQRFALALLIGGLFSGTIFYTMSLYTMILNMHMSLGVRFIIYITINLLAYICMGVYQMLKRKKKKGENYGNIKA